MRAADVMVSKVITVGPDTSVATIAEILLANRISAVPVIDEKSGGLLGIVSEGDLIHRVETDTEQHRAWWLEILVGKETLAREFVKSHARKAADVMTHPVVTVSPDTPLGELASLLEKHRIKRVPVVKDGKIVGIVSRANLIQALVTLGATIEPGASADDSVLRASLLGQLQSKPWWTNNINIIVKDGIVELWGFVESPAERDAIRVVAEVTPGVRQVSNNLTIETRPSAQ
jgi:CBS domain-containing protein